MLCSSGEQIVISSDADDSCVICGDERNESVWWRCAKCTFGCHKKCIKRWSELALTCPYCRRTIESDTLYEKEELLFMLFILCTVPRT